MKALNYEENIRVPYKSARKFFYFFHKNTIKINLIKNLLFSINIKLLLNIENVKINYKVN